MVEPYDLKKSHAWHRGPPRGGGINYTRETKAAEDSDARSKILIRSTNSFCLAGIHRRYILAAGKDSFKDS